METLEQVQNAIEAGDLEQARDLLRPVLRDEPSAQAWYLAAQAAINEKQRRVFLEKAVELDPLHARAGNALYALDHPQPAHSAPQPVAIPLARPENQPESASFLQRAGAFLIDQILMAIVLYPIMLFLVNNTFSDSPTFDNTTAMRFTAIFLTFVLMVQSAFYAYYLAARNGQTPGKRLLGLRVVRRDGQPLTIWDALLRSLIGYTLSGLAFGLGFLWVEIDPRSQGWHDLVADTQVIMAEKTSQSA